MTYRHTSGFIGAQPIAETSTTQKHNVGLICKANDPTYGEGEFIYLKGVASTVVGSLVDYDNNALTTTLSPATGGTGPVAVAMSVNVLNQFGWYQIEGVAAVKAPSVAAVGDVYMLAATPGSVDEAVVANEAILGAKFVTITGTPSAGLALVQINRPHHGATTP